MNSSLGPRYEGLLTEEILGRGMNELAALAEEFRSPNPSQAQGWLAAWEGRLDNALSDLNVVRDRFRKAQT